MALLLSVAILGTQSIMAAKKDTYTQTLADVVVLIGETIEAMKNNEDANSIDSLLEEAQKGKKASKPMIRSIIRNSTDLSRISSLLKAAKQASKSVVISGPADLNKQRGSSRIKKSRRAFRKGNMQEAIKLAEEGLNYYKKAKAIHFD